VIIPSFVTASGDEAMQDHLIYRTVIKLRQIFSIKHKVDLLEDKLRVNFLNWLDIVSRKIKKVTYFNGDLILVIEGANLITERDKHIENSMKFWIPR